MTGLQVSQVTQSLLESSATRTDIFNLQEPYRKQTFLRKKPTP